MTLGNRLTPGDLVAIASAVGSPVVHIRRIDTGQSATTDVLERSSDGARIVVRRHGTWATRNDAAVALRERSVLRALRARGIPVPDVAWAGDISGRPTLITELVDGEAILQPEDPVPWAHQLAVTLAGIHGITDDGALRVALAKSPESPSDAVDRGAVLAHPDGSELLALRTALAGELQPVDLLTHGDFHPGNLLWKDGRVTAVLDWEAAHLGDPIGDLAYCAIELRYLGCDEAADALESAYSAVTGHPLTSFPYWTVTAVCRSIADLESIVRSWEGLGHTVALGTVRERQDRLVAGCLEQWSR